MVKEIDKAEAKAIEAIVNDYFNHSDDREGNEIDEGYNAMLLTIACMTVTVEFQAIKKIIQ